MFTLRNVLMMLCLSIGLAHAQGHDHGDDGHDHAQNGHDHGNSDHDDDHGHAAVSTTLWNASHEYFVEYDMPAAGNTVDLLIHVTRLADWQPITSGALEVIQTPERGPAKTTRLDAPIRPGIYQTPLKFPIAGNWQVRLKLLGTDKILSQTTIPVRVYADAQQFPDAEDDHGSNQVTLLKEQQWRTAFDTQPVTERMLYESVSGNGVLMPTPQGQARISAPLRGRFELAPHTSSNLGTQVKKGQVLGYLVPTLTQADDPAGLAAAVSQAELDIEYAKQEYERLQRLLKREVVAEVHVRAAEKKLRLAQQTLKTAQLRLQQTSVTASDDQRLSLLAPITGTIVAVEGISGSFVEAGADLFQIVDLKTLWLKVQVPAAQLVDRGAPHDARFQLEGSNRFQSIGELGGKLMTVGSVVDPNTRRLSVIYQLPNPDGHLRVGMFAEVTLLHGDGKPQVAIPTSAVLQEKGQAMVYLQTGGESFESRWVRLGVTQGDLVQIKDGLAAGERVVTQGAYGVLLASKADVVPDHGHAH